VVGRTQAIKELSTDWRIRILLIVFIFLGVFPLAFKGLEFGLDFEGGSIIQLVLERPVDELEMDIIISVLENRLNGFGLKDISVKPFGDKFITIEVSETEKQGIDRLKEILSKQGRFEAIIDGNIALTGEDLIAVSTNPQDGYEWRSSTGLWQVPFSLSSSGSKKFAEVSEGRCKRTAGEVECDSIYMFIDRPQNAAILMPTVDYEREKEMRTTPSIPSSSSVSIEEFERNVMNPIFAVDSIADILEELKSGGFTKIIIPENTTYDIALLEQEGFEVIERPKLKFYWLWSAANLRTILSLTEGVTSGQPIRNAIITGSSPTLEDAQFEMTSIVVLLKSGKLPVEISIASTMFISPTLGKNFLKDAILIGLVSLLAVALVIFLRYRHIKIMLAIMLNNIFEATIILGVASLIGWQIDLAAMAGIIAALGTGVDHLIVITDEALRGTTEESGSMVTRIKRAFSIVVIAGLTTLGAMVPLMTMGLGLLKGFAITTMIGVIIGIVIVRPAFAKIIEKIA